MFDRYNKMIARNKYWITIKYQPIADIVYINITQKYYPGAKEL